MVYKVHIQGGNDNTAPFSHNHLYVSSFSRNFSKLHPTSHPSEGLCSPQAFLQLETRVQRTHYPVCSALCTKLSTKYTVQYWRPTVIDWCAHETSIADRMGVHHEIKKSRNNVCTKTNFTHHAFKLLIFPFITHEHTSNDIASKM